jgi:hypothetical protein
MVFGALADVAVPELDFFIGDQPQGFLGGSGGLFRHAAIKLLSDITPIYSDNGVDGRIVIMNEYFDNVIISCSARWTCSAGN